MDFDTIKSKTKLKDCPFCGNKAVMKYATSKGRKIQCVKCHVKMEQHVLKMSIEWLEEKIIESWNKRTES